ncbi:MAG: PqiC family protein [Verrucomicrobiota bacterium]
MKRKLNALCLLGLTGLLLAGCSIGGKSTPSRFYVLSPSEEVTPQASFEGAPPPVGVSRIMIPGYLDRPQMVTSVAPNELKYSEFNRWGEPLQQGITETMRRNLIVHLGTDKVSAFPWMQEFPRDYNIQLVFQNFEGHSYRNEVVMRAVIRIEALQDKRTTVYVDEVSHTIPVSGDDMSYDASVEALSKCLAYLSQQIATAIEKLEAERANQPDTVAATPES